MIARMVSLSWMAFVNSFKNYYSHAFSTSVPIRTGVEVYDFPSLPGNRAMSLA